jgi:phosphoribosyl-AMP cyclohydrolase
VNGKGDKVSDLKFNEKGLIPAIVQDDETGEVLMLGYMSEESIRRTLDSREVWFFSRSRQQLWHKGETSGNKILVRSLWLDCDNDTILVKAHPTGPVCHTGSRSCFFREMGRADTGDGERHEGR